MTPKNGWLPAHFWRPALFVYSLLLLEDDRLLLGIPLLILSIGYWIAGIFLFCGLKTQAQEALVLTLFGDYGHPEGPGLLLGKPLLHRRQPGRRTKLSQSGDVERRAAPCSLSGQSDGMVFFASCS